MANNKVKGTRVSWRRAVSLMTASMFFIMGVTGFVLYFVPQGRIAYWVDWRFLGLTKTNWGNIHIVTSVIFLVVGGWHLFFNWNAFVNHLRLKLAEKINLRKELLATMVLTVFIVVSALWHIPPLGYLLDINRVLKNSWIDDESHEPPFGHAELLTLEVFCDKMSISPIEAMLKLKENSIEVESARETLEHIAQRNQLSPKDIYALIDNGIATAGAPKIGGMGRGPGRAMGRGKSFARGGNSWRVQLTGIGRKTISEACEESGEKVAKCLERLERENIPAKPHETVRSLAVQMRMRPIELLGIMTAAHND